MDPRHEKLAHILVNHSCRLQSGEQVLIEAFDLPEMNLLQCIVREVRKVGAIPHVQLRGNAITRTWLLTADEATLSAAAAIDADRMKQMQAYIGVRASDNSAELSDVPSNVMEMYSSKYMKPVHFEIRVPETRWVVLRYPTPSMAQSANMSTEAFENFYYSVTTVDYAAMEQAEKPLVERMNAAKNVRIVAPDTDLKFSIENIPVVPCFGRRNIPDGEVFTAPVRNSVQGRIHYNIPSRYSGTVFRDVCFDFEDGRIVKASCAGESKRLNEILDTDEGARYIGEFSLGVNYNVQQAILDTLFDEKIGGSLHFTPGNAYTTADNGNRSGVHWDLILSQRPDDGGGEVWFDDELIRKDGRFVPEDLQGLNP